MSAKTNQKAYIRKLEQQRDYLQSEVDRLSDILKRLPKNGSGVIVTPGDELWISDTISVTPFSVKVTSGIVVQYPDGEISRDFASRYFNTPEEAVKARVFSD